MSFLPLARAQVRDDFARPVEPVSVVVSLLHVQNRGRVGSLQARASRHDRRPPCMGRQQLSAQVLEEPQPLDTLLLPVSVQVWENSVIASNSAATVVPGSPPCKLVFCTGV